MTGNVIDLFTGQPVAELMDESEFIRDFMEKRFGDFAFALQAMVEATTEQDFIDQMQDVKDIVKGWPSHA